MITYLKFWISKEIVELANVVSWLTTVARLMKIPFFRRVIKNDLQKSN